MFYLQAIIRNTKSMTMRWAGHVVSVREEKYMQKFNLKP